MRDLLRLTGPGLDGPLVTIERACELLHCRRTRLFELIAEGRLARGPRFGKKTTLTRESVLRCIEAPIKIAPKPGRPRRNSTAAAEAARAAFRRGLESGRTVANHWKESPPLKV